MAFLLSGFYPDSRAGGQRIHTYSTSDTIATMTATGYFNDLAEVLEAGNKILALAASGGGTSWYALTVTSVVAGASPVVNIVYDVNQELTVSGDANPGIQSMELNHISNVIAARIVDSKAHQGMFVVKNTSASGTAAHTLTLVTGTFDGTNTVATLNAPGEALAVWFDSNGTGVILENIGAVVLS